MKTLGLFPRPVVFLFFCLFRFFSFGAEHYFYKQITLDAGLPTTLTCIFADTRGFIWTGTKAGLGRFDGHDQKRYINRRNDITSLPGNHIYQIIEDRHHNLWILTDMGVALYNYRYNNFTTLTDEQGGPCVAYSVCLWKDELLFGGKNIVYIYDKKTNRLKKRYELKLEEDFEIARIAAIAPGTLLCCSRWNGICAINMQNGTLVNSPFGPEKEITDMFIDSEQRIWIAPYNQGLRCFSVSGKEIASYTTRNSAIKSNIVICITERQGQIW
ncbi:two-component regulator propeller domain-containing protein, partial [Bacteroides heparinolyticus]